MLEVTPETAADYLRERGRVPASRDVRVQALGWGVSNVVMRVDVEGEPAFVLKQARERLRTKALWISRLDRIWTERAALDLLGQVLPDADGVIPRVLFAEPDDYLFAMTCAPDDSVVWKERLLAGEADVAVTRAAGSILGSIHRETSGHPALQQAPLAETVVFGQLRIDPFYRTIARVHPDLAPEIHALIESLADPVTRTFVHADFSPKNILVHSAGLTLVDFETAHAGDPAYDLGFVLSHLLLKGVRAVPADGSFLALTRTFHDAYLERVGALLDPGLVRRACLHAAACSLARVDGTSPVDYLDAAKQATVRQFARAALHARPATWDEVLDLLAREMQTAYSF
ncbi:Phosphotransferase enzyme family protein [Singulisphaera sp. GP187]|uniref:phosphotransferase family protein n=1 Tax=Singulisphaera sp. GP187 TaxID=1882752 RepID=UPI00092C20E0|nr:phosphotransferase [Singulisphaera sp. GP187]SIO29180.1 Phosphotransferase enzyme family protein [Singulisphaera sp. GP187]